MRVTTGETLSLANIVRTLGYSFVTCTQVTIPAPSLSVCVVDIVMGTYGDALHHSEAFDILHTIHYTRFTSAGGAVVLHVDLIRFVFAVLISTGALRFLDANAPRGGVEEVSTGTITPSCAGTVTDNILGALVLASSVA